ncbi:MAG: hypothetical protein NC390_04625 [Fusobacterium sp.]|nr:hypothetical protein [Fusobacterium sp.]
MTSSNELDNLIKLYKTYKARPIDEAALGNKLIILNNILDKIIESATGLNLDVSMYKQEKQNLKDKLTNLGIKIKNI